MLLRLKGNFCVMYIKMTTRAIYAYVLIVIYVLGQVNYKIILMTMMANSPFYCSIMDMLAFWRGGGVRWLVRRLMATTMACSAIKL